ncbi:MAG: PAS domain S-box protein [bacterium]|nr:PAS domain S-box protein [bacterium]
MTKPDHPLTHDLFVQTPAMIAIVRGSDFVFEFANPLYLKVVGKTEAIIGKPLLEAMPELKGQPVLKILRDVYKTGKPHTGKEVPINLDVKGTGRAEERYFNFVYQPLKNEMNKVDGIMTHAVDVTDQVTSRKNVEISEAKYKSLFDSIGQGFCVIELLFNKNNKPVNYRFLETNKLFEKQSGLKRAVGKTVLELVPNIEPHWFEKYGKVLKTGRRMSFTDDSKAMGRWFDIDAWRVGELGSNQVAVLFTDITARRQVELNEKLASKQALDVLESMGDAFFMLDKEWRITRVNRVQEKVSQTKRADTIGKIFWEVFPTTAEPGSKYWTEYHKVMKTRKPSHFLEHYAPLDMWTEVDVYPTADSGISVFFRDVTLRKKAENSLHESEERFRTLIEQSTDAIQLVNPEGKILYSSESLKNVLGYTPEELKEEGVAPYLYPDDVEYFNQKLVELVNIPGGQVQLQYRVKHKDGSWAWLETTGVNHLETPNIHALVGTFRNITERKKSEEATEYQNSLLKAQMEVSPLGIIIVSETGAIVSHNKRFARMWRFPKKVLDSDLDEMALKAAQKQLKDPKQFIERVTYLYTAREASNELLYFKDGRIFDRYGSPIFGEDGKYYGYVWYFLDITEQKQAEEAVKANEEHLRFMAESMPQKVFTATSEGEVDYFNPQWMEYTGLTFEQIRDWGWLQFIHPDDVDENIRTWKHSIRTGEPFELEHRFRAKDGSYHWHFSRAHAMHNKQGKIIKWVGSNTDIESVKRTQNYTRQLEDLTATLKQQKVKLIKLNEAKDDFILLASHQLRTPATGVKQYLGMVLENFTGEVPAEQRQMLEQANVSNERQITIINDLLKVAQLDAGRVVLSKKPISIGAMIEQAMSDHESQFRDRNQKVILKLPKDEVNATVDQARMRMVLDNLIDNASKYTPHGKKIELGALQGRKTIKVWVSDEGVGIAPEDIDKLFHKFSRLDNPLSVQVGGTGLGLYWAKKIIDLHGGSLLVASVLDVGTTFTIKMDRDN